MTVGKLKKILEQYEDDFFVRVHDNATLEVFELKEDWSDTIYKINENKYTLMLYLGEEA